MPHEDIISFKKQSNSQQKSEQLSELISELKNNYDPEFGITEKPQLLIDLSQFYNIDFPDFIYDVVMEKYDVNFVLELYKNRPDDLKKKRIVAKKRNYDDEGLRYCLDLLGDITDKVILAKRVGDKNMWKELFYNIFIDSIDGFETKEDLKAKMVEICSFRNGTIGHPGPGAKIRYSKIKQNNVKVALNQFQVLMAYWRDKYLS